MSIDTNSLPFAEVLLAARRSEATPWLTWYSAEGERIELSGRVFDNWVAKSANLLGELFDIEPGSTVVIDTPIHWKTLVLALAALHRGATLLPAEHPDAGQAGLWVTGEPESTRIPASAEILAVDLAALALSFSGELGPVAEDYNATVRSFADDFFPAPVPGNLPALQLSDGSCLSYAQIFSPSAQARGTILLAAPLPLEQVLPYAIAQWSVGDALVLAGPGVQITERLRQGERITADYRA